MLEEAAQARGRPANTAAEPFRVFAWHWPVFQLWVDVWNAWRWVPKGIDGAARDGLDRSQVESTMAMKGIDREEWPKLFRDLRVMEQAALKFMAGG